MNLFKPTGRKIILTILLSLLWYFFAMQLLFSPGSSALCLPDFDKPTPTPIPVNFKDTSYYLFLIAINSRMTPCAQNFPSYEAASEATSRMFPYVYIIGTVIIAYSTSCLLIFYMRKLKKRKVRKE